MTNAEKYLKDGVDIKEFADKLDYEGLKQADYQARGEISKTKTIAIIKNGNEKLTIEVENYTRGYGDVLIRTKDGRTYITSDFLIIKE